MRQLICKFYHKVCLFHIYKKPIGVNFSKKMCDFLHFKLEFTPYFVHLHGPKCFKWNKSLQFSHSLLKNVKYYKAILFSSFKWKINKKKLNISLKFSHKVSSSDSKNKKKVFRFFCAFQSLRKRTPKNTLRKLYLMNYAPKRGLF